mmetsp:Transcript_1208/g.3249  ORF Transcript_1208/g.3249 Transcript_1208/m.3249 type:complete len:329 (-) Transcript_1208:167-1153(-)
MRASAVATAVVAAVGLTATVATCESPECSKHTTRGECDRADGCVYKSLDEGNRSTGCVKDDSRIPEAEEEQLQWCDMSVDPCTAALLLGALGGVCAAALPCSTLQYRTQQRYAELLVSTSECKAKRTKAFVRTKWFEPAPGGKHGGRGRLHIEFIALRSTGVAYIVDAKIAVAQEFYDKVHPGQQLPVAYVLDDERVFEVVPDANVGRAARRERSMTGCALVCLAAFGVAVAAASQMLTGCFLGYIPFFVLLVLGTLLGHFLGWPLARKWKQATSFVTVRQCAFPAGEALGAQTSDGPCPSTSATTSVGWSLGKDVSSTFASISPCAP